MKMVTNTSTHEDLSAAVTEVLTGIWDAEEKPNLVLLSCTVGYDVPKFYDLAKASLVEIPFQGGTSCSAVMTEDGYISADGRAMSAVAFWDEDTAFGVSCVSKGDDPKQAAITALEQAIDNAERSGELPSAIWLLPSPGGEEAIIEGIKEVAGGDIPLIGGSAADNTIEGNWYQFTQEEIQTDSVSLVVIYRDDYIITAGFHSGYDPSENKGVCTKTGDRVIYEIDGKKAAEVYNDWTGGAITKELAEGGHILSASNLFPIGRKVGAISGIDYFQLSHPETVTDEKGISLFTDISEGEQIICMQGSVENLTQRVGNVVRSCLERDDIKQDEVEGALIIFCAGCMMTIGDRMNEAYQSIKDVFGDGVPFWAMFTFGEQGSLAGGENCHGNLMISTLVFTNREQ